MNFADLIRWSITLTALTLLVSFMHLLWRTPLRTSIGGWALLALPPALVFSHLWPLPAFAWLPVGLGLSAVAAVATLKWGDANEAFTHLPEGSWQTLMLFRAIFGSQLVAVGGAGLLPTAFTVPAGVGDLVVGLLAAAHPLHRGASPVWRLLVSGLGLADLANVIRLVANEVLPFLVANPGGQGISLLLPWVGVPLLLLVNVHGFRLALTDLRRPSP